MQRSCGSIVVAAFATVLLTVFASTDLVTALITHGLLVAILLLLFLQRPTRIE